MAPSKTPVFQQTPSELIMNLIRAGWSHSEIALSVDSTQATISRIYNGVHKDPRHSIVRKLQELVLHLGEFDKVAK